MRLLVVILLALLLPIATADGQRNCTKGKPCGNTCIARNKTCRVGTPSSAPSTGATPSPSAPSSSPARTVMPSASLADTLGLFVASSRGQVYYLRTCSAAQRLAAQNRVYFKSEEEAEAAGYRRSTSRGC